MGTAPGVAAAKSVSQTAVVAAPPPAYQAVYARPTPELAKLLQLRSVNPLYGMYLIRELGIANRAERVQAMESVLELPGSVGHFVRVPVALETLALARGGHGTWAIVFLMTRGAGTFLRHIGLVKVESLVALDAAPIQTVVGQLDGGTSQRSGEGLMALATVVSEGGVVRGNKAGAVLWPGCVRLPQSAVIQQREITHNGC